MKAKRNFKKQALALSALAMLCMGGANAAFAQDGTITFIGSVTADSCAISTDSKDIIVDFGQMSDIGDGDIDHDSEKKFTINLTNCPDSAATATVNMTGEGGNGSDSHYFTDYVDGNQSSTDYWFIYTYEGSTKSYYNINGSRPHTFTIKAGDNQLEQYASLNGNHNVGIHTGEATYTVTYQ